MTLNRFLPPLIFLSILILPVGQLLRFTTFGGAVFTPLDVAVGGILLIFLYSSPDFKKIVKYPFFRWWALFNAWALVTLIFSLNFFSISEVISGAMFWVRWVGYSGLLYVVLLRLKKEEKEKAFYLLIISSFVIAILGFIQFVIYKDLSFLAPLGWDPHQNRIVSTFLDPNFLAGFLVLSSCLVLAKLEKKMDKRKQLFLLVSLGAFILAIVLTFSRSGYLSLLVAVLLFSALRLKWISFLVIMVLILSLVMIPKVGERLRGAFEFDETSQARVLSWSNAWTIASENPLVGVGFNNYRYAQLKSDLIDEAGFESHSATGSDSSLLLVLATTGFMGLFLFLMFYLNIAREFLKKNKRAVGLTGVIMIVSLFAHTQFVNSIFYPSILFFVSIAWGVMIAED